ncbi:MAG: cobalamin biosynthesis protein CbiG [Desulfobulbaceae bacterium]|nr:cobalamin biosynthesis protein CbiG [Desulfobulbaceae bacterium]
MKCAVLAITKGGCRIGKKLAEHLPGARFFNCRGRLREILSQAWQEYEGLICIMASGIVVRTIAPLLVDKRKDPAVVVCDEKGEFAISLVSGHLGGGNILASKVAAILQGQAVITTASDVLGHIALDLWATELGLQAADKEGFTKVMGQLVNNGTVTVYSEYPLPELPPDILPATTAETADLIVTSRTSGRTGGVLLHPRSLVAGVGCNRGTGARDIGDALAEACELNGLALASIRNLASIDLKKDEQGLLDFAAYSGYSIDFFNRDQLNGVQGVSTSAVVLKATGAKGVAEPAAVLSADNGALIVRKMKWTDVTIAIAEVASPWSEQDREQLIS